MSGKGGADSTSELAWDRSKLAPATSPTLSRALSQAVVDTVEVRVPRGVGPGDAIQAVSAGGRRVMVVVPGGARSEWRTPQVVAHPGTKLIASLPPGSTATRVIGRLDHWQKGRGLKGDLKQGTFWPRGWPDPGGDEAEEGGADEEEAAEEEEEEEEGGAAPADAGSEASGETAATAAPGGRAEAWWKAPAPGGRQLHMPRLGPTSKIAGTGRPLQVVRNEVVRVGRRDYFIDPVLPPPETPQVTQELLRRIMAAMEAEGWEMTAEERIPLQIYYMDPEDGCWLQLNDRVYREIFIDELGPAFVARPKLMLRAAKTMPTTVRAHHDDIFGPIFGTDDQHLADPADPRAGWQFVTCKGTKVCKNCACADVHDGEKGAWRPDENLRSGRQAYYYMAGGRWQHRGRRPLQCARCGKECDFDFEMEEHEAWHLRQAHHCPYPDCPYTSKRRGTMKHHWKGHLANSYRLCADGGGWRSAETDLAAEFIPGDGTSEKYTRELAMVHRMLTTGLFARDAAGLRNALVQAEEQVANIHVETESAVVRGVVEPKLMHAARAMVAVLEGKPPPPKQMAPAASDPLAWLLRQFGLGRYLGAFKASLSRAGYADRLAADPALTAEKLDYHQVLTAAGDDKAVRVNLEKLRKLDGMPAMESGPGAGSLRALAARVGIVAPAEQTRLAEMAAHAIASGLTAAVVCGGKQRVRAPPQFKLSPQPATWPPDGRVKLHLALRPPRLRGRMAADVKRPRFLADIRKAVTKAFAAKGGAPVLMESVRSSVPPTPKSPLRWLIYRAAQVEAEEDQPALEHVDLVLHAAPGKAVELAAEVRGQLAAGGSPLLAPALIQLDGRPHCFAPVRPRPSPLAGQRLINQPCRAAGPDGRRRRPGGG
jgi:hypothetical protein